MCLSVYHHADKQWPNFLCLRMFWMVISPFCKMSQGSSRIKKGHI